MKKALIIYNPVSGSKSWKNVPDIIERALKKHGYKGTWFETKNVKKQPLEPFAKKRFDRIIAIGGDGTVAEVAAFMIKNKIKTPLVIIPQGSANILATTLHLPLFSVSQAIKKGLTQKAQPIDAMKVNNQHIGLIATGCGYDVLIMKHTTRNLKRTLGAAAYAWIFLKTFFTYKAHPYKLTIDGKRHYISAKSILVFNLMPFQSLKLTKHLIPEKILPTDQTLNIVAFNPSSLWDLFKSTPKIQTFKGKSIHIKAKQTKSYEVDGDIFKGKNVNIEMIPKAIQIVHTKTFK
jgi:diacylglycerol kinase (ATP)